MTDGMTDQAETTLPFFGADVSLCPTTSSSAPPADDVPASAARHCLVSVHAPLGRRLFQYKIPDHISDLTPGTAVLVPFRSRDLVGWVAEMDPESPVDDGMAVKFILEKIDGAGLRPDDLQICRRLQDLYGTNFSDILALFVPPSAPRPVRILEQTEQDSSAPQSEATPRGAAASEAFGAVQQAGGRIGLDRLRRMLNEYPPRVVDAAIRELTDSGHFRLRTRVQSVRPGQKKYLGLSEDPPSVSSSDLDPSHKKILDIVDRHPFQFGGAEIARLAKAAVRDVRKLVAARLLVERTQRRWRTPLERRDDSTAPRLDSTLTPTAGQREAIREITRVLDARAFESFLLFGPTASGKTLVYEMAARHALALGRQVLLLVPEIALTKSLVDRIKDRIAEPIAVIHSRQTPAERRDEWQRCADGTARLLVGPRSAAFVPLPDLGLAIVDECHDAGYKQSDSPYVDARVAIEEKCRLAGAPIVSGSATPTVEQLWSADKLQSRTRRLDLTECPTRHARPEALVVDLRKIRPDPRSQNRRSFLTPPLEAAIAETLTRKESVVLLMNRRGFAPQITCPACGHTERCGKCLIAMTYHASERHLLCHGCGQIRPTPAHCPVCRVSPLDYLGAGTERIEDDCRRMFHRARIARLDGDVLRRSRRDAFDVLERLKLGQIDILIGTQMIAKGLDVPSVTLAAVVMADVGLNMPDYRSRERTFQLLAQVIGRSGRHASAGRAIIQTFQPDNPAIQCSLNEDVLQFYELERADREAGLWPPFCRLVRIVVQSRNAPRALQTARQIRENLASSLPPPPDSSSPLQSLSDALAAPWPKINDEYRFQILIKLRPAAIIPPQFGEVCRDARASEVTIRVEPDPSSLL